VAWLGAQWINTIPLGGRWNIFFCIFFLCFIFSTITFSATRWVWPGFGRLRAFFLLRFLHHHFIKTLRAAEGEKQTKSSVFLEEQKEDKGFLKKSGFENG
jgi:hypothetical protein